jgi:ABC-type transport system involved in multi-copper enzyme maturation permease subunit
LIALLPAEIRRQTGRRGTFYGSIGVCLLIVVFLAIWVFTAHQRPMRWEIVNNGMTLISAFAVLCSVVIGAIAGAYDTDQGTMRYLVLTGRPRWQLVIVRFLALFVTVALFVLPALLLILLLSAFGTPTTPALLHEGDVRTGGAQVFDLFYTVMMSGYLYGILALAIGTFLRSNGVAIAVAIVLNFAGVLAAGLIYTYVSKELANAFYPVVAGAVIARESANAGDTSAGTISLGGSAAILVVWVVALVGAAWARVQRSEF